MKMLSGKNGFTLIEVIVVLVILGIVAIVLGNAIVYGVRGYVFAHNANQSSQKAQLAISRLNAELLNITAVSAASADQIDYSIPQSLPSCDLDEGCKYSIKRNGTIISIEATDSSPFVSGAQTLVEGLNSTNGGKVFLTYCKQGESSSCTWSTTDGFETLATIKIQIVLDFAGGSPLSFQASINPRENGILTAPAPPPPDISN